MIVTLSSPADLGLLVRAVRRSSGLRLDDLAATAGLSKQFAADVEHGKPTVQLGRVLQLLAELGLPLSADITEQAAHELAGLRAKGGLPPPKKRRPPRAAPSDSSDAG